MGMVADFCGPRPFTLYARWFTTAFAVTLLFTASNVAAQDRVVLFDETLSASGSLLPQEIREFEITEGGRRWSLVRRTTIPGHLAGPPVLLADGSRLLWLAFSNAGNFALLVQYEFATARASIVDIGRFARQAFLVADPSALRVAIVEPTRVTFVDARLQPYAVVLPGSKVTQSADAADGYVVLKRSGSGSVEAVLINAETAEVVRTIALLGDGTTRVTRDGQRLYHHYFPDLEVRSLTTGQLLVRAADVRSASQSFFELDESRGLVLHDKNLSDGSHILARDATTLALLGELGPGVFTSRYAFRLEQTRNEGAILLFSRQITGSPFTDCASQSPRIDVFDGTTFALISQIDLQGRCAAIIPLSPR